jgi:hypothetical protein
VVLIAIGLVHVSQAKTAAGTIGGGIWILAGTVLIGNRIGLFHANIWNFWPLILVLVGGRIVWQTMETNRAVEGLHADRGCMWWCLWFPGRPPVTQRRFLVTPKVGL